MAFSGSTLEKFLKALGRPIALRQLLYLCSPQVVCGGIARGGKGLRTLCTWNAEGVPKRLIFREPGRGMLGVENFGFVKFLFVM